MAKLLKGKPVSDAINARIASQLSRFDSEDEAFDKKADDGNVVLTTIRVGDNPADAAYERSIKKAASNLGIQVVSNVFEDIVDTDKLLEIINDANLNSDVDGIMLFRPLPKHIDESAVCNAIASHKDIDGVNALSLAGVFMGISESFAPATAKACMALLGYYDIPVEGKHIVIVGRSLVVGKPLGMLMLDDDATVTYCHSRTNDLSSITRLADIVVCAVGRPRFFDSTYFSSGQIVLDVGINEDEEGNLCGDVDFEPVEKVVDAITPVPGGIGSISTAILMQHVVEAAA